MVVVCCLLCVVCCLLFVKGCVLCVVCCLLRAVCCVLLFTACVLFVVCCVLFVVCCLSFVVCCLVCVVVCCLLLRWLCCVSFLLLFVCVCVLYCRAFILEFVRLFVPLFVRLFLCPFVLWRILCVIVVLYVVLSVVHSFFLLYVFCAHVRTSMLFGGSFVIAVVPSNMQSCIHTEDLCEDDADNIAPERDSKRARVSEPLLTAELQQLEDDDTSTFPSGVKGCIEYACELHWVDSDVLAKFLPEKKKASVTVKIVPLEPFDWDTLAAPAMRRIAAYVLDALQVQCYESIRNVAVERFEEEDTKKILPDHIQVKALKDFKVGEVVLSPFGMREGCLLSIDDPQCKKYEQCDLLLMKRKCVPRAWLRVATKEDKRKKPKAEPGQEGEGAQHFQSTFYIVNPRFFVRETLESSPHDSTRKQQLKTDLKFSPFWALDRTSSSRDCNMCLQKMIFDLPSPIACKSKMPSAPRKAMWIIAVQCATNTRKIRKGEVLSLSLMDDIGEDSQSERDELEKDE